MADTYTTNLNLTKPEPGAAEDTWGISLNDDLDTLDAIFSSSGTQVNLNPNQVNFADNKKAIFGTGSDLQIYHDGTDSYIDDAGAGDLRIRSNFLKIEKYTGETMATFNDDNAVTLYFNNAAKLATSSTGINVTGTTATDTLDVDDVKILSAQSSTVTDDVAALIYRTSGHASYANGDLIIQARSNASRDIYFLTGSTTPVNRMQINGNGDISFYDDTGTTQGVFWDASAESLGIGTTSVSAKLHVESANNYNGTNFESNPHLAIDNGTPTNHTAVLMFESSGTDASNKRSGITGGNYYSNKHGLGFFGDLASKDRSATPDMFVNSSGNVGIGTDSPARELSIGDGTGSPNIQLLAATAGNSRIEFGDTDDSDAGEIQYVHSDNYMQFTTNGSERMRIDSSGNVAIGNTSAGAKLDIRQDSGTAIRCEDGTGGYFVVKHGGQLGIGTASPQDKLSIEGGNVSINNGSAFQVGGSVSGNTVIGTLKSESGVLTLKGDSTRDVQFGSETNGTAMFIEGSNGNVGIGTNNPIDKLHVEGNLYFGTSTRTIYTGSSANLHLQTNTGEILFLRNNGSSEVMRIDDNNRVGIGTSSPSAKLHVKDNTTVIGNDTSGYATLNFHSATTGSARYGSIRKNYDSPYDMRIRASNSTDSVPLIFETSSSVEVARFDSSGNLLVSTTTNPVSSSSVTGLYYEADNYLAVATAGVTSYFNRQGSDGDITHFRKDGTTVGSIGVVTSDNLYIQGNATHVGFAFGSSAIVPFKNGSYQDDTVDLGNSTGRYQDIYATNGTIQTSDINEKQDIEDLSEAETRVAVAAKGLLKKYRWKSAVADKGNDARIHFGIMAQDLENAFANEGLDAGDYGMFISSTWTDEATGEEKTRLGVRYNELLAFIIAAI